MIKVRGVTATPRESLCLLQQDGVGGCKIGKRHQVHRMECATLIQNVPKRNRGAHGEMLGWQWGWAVSAQVQESPGWIAAIAWVRA